MQLTLIVNGVEGTVVLWTDDAPTTVSAVVSSLPVVGVLKQCRWSGDACFTHFGGGPVESIAAVELPAVTIYPGTLAVRLAQPESAHAELLVGYGAAEHRWPDGPKPVTPIGEITEGRAEIFEQLRSVASAGEATIRLAVKPTGASA